MHRVLVTGGAGFIGSRLSEQLLARGREVVVLDDFSLGRREFLSGCLSSPRFRLVEGDLRSPEILAVALEGVGEVYHLAANSDIRAALIDPGIDYRLEIEGTYRLLQGLRSFRVERLIFASSSVVYGDQPVFPTPEDDLALPISMYGAGKLAGEAMISAWAHLFGLKALILRFANVVGPRSTHGILHDFMNKLDADPARLEVLGDGEQEKSFLHVEDCVEGMMFLAGREIESLVAYNLAPVDAVSVREIADMFLAETGSSPRVFFAGGRRGWPGDVPRMSLDPTRAAAAGWQARHTSAEAVRRAIRELMEERGARCRR